MAKEAPIWSEVITHDDLTRRLRVVCALPEEGYEGNITISDTVQLHLRSITEARIVFGPAQAREIAALLVKYADATEDAERELQRLREANAEETRPG